MSGRPRIGFAVSAHGFGHAARATAVMMRLKQRRSCDFTIVTEVPAWFFEQCLGKELTYHALPTDLGLIQRTALVEDIPATLRALDELYPLPIHLVETAANHFRHCDLIVADIAPVGIAAAKQLGIPSVLIENFTWDWIYGEYVRRWPGFSRHMEYLADLYGQVDHHVQAIPICRPSSGAITVKPIARPLRQDRAGFRQQLGLAAGQRLVAVTMGGVPGNQLALEPFAARDDCLFILPSAKVSGAVPANVRLVPADSGLYHPDLVAAADLVVGKVGYSTLAEVYQGGVPWAYVPRQGFAESRLLETFIREHMRGERLSAEQLTTGSWLGRIDPLCALPSPLRMLAGRFREVDALLLELLDVNDHGG